jgi:hypothetical protein
VPKWYSRAPNGSGRIDTRGSTSQGRSRSKVTAGSVDTAHAVDRDLFDQQFVAAEDFLVMLGHAYLPH